jgi:hypothetical protein
LFRSDGVDDDTAESLRGELEWAIELSKGTPAGVKALVLMAKLSPREKRPDL